METWFDIIDDWDLIEASFAIQYPQVKIPADNEEDDITRDRFVILLSGIMPDTPLGNIIRIRSETDPEVIKHMTPGQRRIRDEWLSKKRHEKYDNMTEEEKLKLIEEAKKAFASMFS